jgi:signal transduction histidine kinase
MPSDEQPSPFDALEPVLDRALLGLAELDAAGKIVHASARFAGLMGLTAARCVGKDIHSFLQEEDRERLALHIRRLRGASDVGIEVTLVAGEMRTWARLQFVGNPQRPLVLATDLSHKVGESRAQEYEKTRLEERVNERTGELESLVRELQAFNNLVTHDLRTPVRVVQGFSEFALTEAGRLKSPKLQEYLRNIRDGTSRMNAIIEGLQRLSHMSRRELRRERVDLAQIAQRLVVDLRRRAPKRKIRLVVEEDMETFADPDMVEILLQNLLENAWKFTSKKEQAEITVGKKRKGDRDFYYVSDNGAGFNPALQDQLFQPFRRLHRADEFEGTGLGLATVHQIVRRHRGRIFAESELGSGATFYFTLSHWKDWI